MYRPLVKVGAALVSAARNLLSASPLSLSLRNGKASPLKFEPAPTRSMTTFGYSPAISICIRASSPMIDWCIRTQLKKLPSPRMVSSRAAVSSIDSLTAIPSEPGLWGSFSWASRPVGVFPDGVHCCPGGAGRVVELSDSLSAWIPGLDQTGLVGEDHGLGSIV